MKSLKARMEREPIACIALAFFLLTGAAAGMTARQILTGVPGAINLSGVAASEGSSTALARIDHGHSLSGTLPQTRGGTGAGAATCTAKQAITSDGTTYSCAQNFVALQAATPGSADTGNAHVNGTIIADTALSLGSTFGDIEPRTNGSMNGLKFTAAGGGSGGAIGAYEFNITTTPLLGPAYQFKGASGSYLEFDGASAGFGSTPANFSTHVVGIGPLGPSSNPLRLGALASVGGTIVDTFASAGTNAVLSVSNNGSATGWSVLGDGSVTKSCRFSLNTGSISPAAVAANTCQTTTIASSSLVVGKPCIASASAALTAGLIPFCEVTSTSNVNYKICNVTTGSVTPPAATTYNACILGG
jgi:hypothetical protein